MSVNPTIVAHLGLIFVIFNMLVLSAAFMVWLERKVCAYIQDRVGPNRVGYEGALQPFADVIKLMFKEQLRPKAADALLFAIAPVISACTAFAAFSVVPFGTETTLFGLLDQPIPLQVTDVNVAVLVVFAITSMGVYGIVLAGWSSNSKYSLLGGLRSSAQMISYELSYGLALAAVIMLAGSLSLREIVMNQAGTWFGFIPRWYLFLQPLGFFIYMCAGVAETNRAPFDFPEAEQELVAGYHTEYSSMSFALFFLAEYVNMVTVSAVATQPVSRRLAGTVPARLVAVDLVPRESLPAAVLLCLDALDAAAVPVRPADGVRLEVAAAGVGDQPAGHGGVGSMDRMKSGKSSLTSGPSAARAGGRWGWAASAKATASVAEAKRRRGPIAN